MCFFGLVSGHQPMRLPHPSWYDVRSAAVGRPYESVRLARTRAIPAATLSQRGRRVHSANELYSIPNRYIYISLSPSNSSHLHLRSTTFLTDYIYIYRFSSLALFIFMLGLHFCAQPEHHQTPTPPRIEGKRMCLGEELAKMLLFAYCGSIVAHFRWSCRPSSVGTVSMQGDCGITLTPPRCEMVFEKKE